MIRLEESNRATHETAGPRKRQLGEKGGKTGGQGNVEKCAKVGGGRSLLIAHVDNRAVARSRRAGGARLTRWEKDATIRWNARPIETTEL